MEVEFGKVILATGARELFLPFPGWTLPGVMGAGGLQAIVKGGMPVAGKKVVVAGSGPLLLAVGAGLRKAGAEVVEIIEQAKWGKLARFVFETGPWAPGKMLQGMGLKARLLGVPYRTGNWVSQAEGSKRVEHVMVTDGKKIRKVACDYLACAYGLAPNLELARMLGCEDRFLGRSWVKPELPKGERDQFCVGEINGIGGVDCALIEGEMAGYVAAGNASPAKTLLRKWRRARMFAFWLETTFALRAEVKAMAKLETIVCRCEDVTRGQMEACEGWRQAKLHTRCGMGPCQGRICGTAAESLFGWEGCDGGSRPPVMPVRVGAMAGSET
jgi:NADPH-dependent 2,4-dienoyl-CoA reductase/sulfur reductase-like enzyme